MLLVHTRPPSFVAAATFSSRSCRLSTSLLSQRRAVSFPCLVRPPACLLRPFLPRAAARLLQPPQHFRSSGRKTPDQAAAALLRARSSHRVACCRIHWIARPGPLLWIGGLWIESFPGSRLSACCLLPAGVKPLAARGLRLDLVSSWTAFASALATLFPSAAGSSKKKMFLLGPHVPHCPLTPMVFSSSLSSRTCVVSQCLMLVGL